MWALELVRHGFESCTLCSDTQQFCGLEQMSSLVVPSNLFPNSKAMISHNIHHFCPFSSSWLSLCSVLFPFLSPPDLLYPSSFCLCLVSGKAPPSQVMSPAQRKAISQLCVMWTWHLPKGQWRYTGTHAHLVTCKVLLRQEPAMTLTWELVSALPTRVSKENSFPHCLPLPSHHQNPDLPVSLQDLPRQGACQIPAPLASSKCTNHQIKKNKHISSQ